MGGYSTPAGARSGTGNMSNMKGQLGTRSSALAPTSSKLTTQYLVLDHMNNHYRKIVSAKSAIDNKVPKSMSTSQKARDRSTREYVKKTGSRPVSRVSVNRMSRPQSQMLYSDDEDIYDERLWEDIDPEDEEEKLVYDIMRTTLKQNKDKESSANATYGGSSGSRNNYDISMPQSQPYQDHERIPSGQVRRPLSTRSVHSATSSVYRARGAQGAPGSAKKGTYDGDLLKTRSHAFTEPEKPFTPRILKSTRSSKLTEYKYYNPTPKKQDKSMEETEVSEMNSTMNTTHTPKPKPRPRTKSPFNRTETPLTDTTLMFESLQSRDFSKYNEDKEEVVPRLDISLDKDHLSWLKEQASKAKIRSKSENLQTTMGKIKEDELLNTQDSRKNDFTMTSSTLGKSQTRTYGTKSLHDSQKLSNEEEELKYVEFMKEVTEDVLNRGVFTNRVLKQVFETHIRKRKGELNEDKMRLMLIQVRKELDIRNDDDADHQDYDMELTDSTYHTTSSGSKFRLSNIQNRYTQMDHTKEKTFDSTLDSQNTFGLKSTESAMFSTIHSQPEDLSMTQALKNYQMDITQKEATETYSPGEIEERHSTVSGHVSVSDGEDDESRVKVKPRPRVIKASSNEQEDEDARSTHSTLTQSTTSTKKQSRSFENVDHEDVHSTHSTLTQSTTSTKKQSRSVENVDHEDVHSTHSTLTQSTSSTMKRQPRSVENDHILSPKPRSNAPSQSGGETVFSSGPDKTAEESEDNEYEEDDYEESGDELVTSTKFTDDEF